MASGGADRYENDGVDTSSYIGGGGGGGEGANTIWVI